MDLSGTLHMTHGKWLVANCGEMPSDNNCKLVIMGPESQRVDLLEAAVSHAVKNHGHADSPQLRTDVNSYFKVVQV
jgi:hypothetical protein